MKPKKTKKPTSRATRRPESPKVRPQITSTPNLTALNDGQRLVGVEPLTVRMEQAVTLSNMGETFLRKRIKDGTLRSIEHGRVRLIDFASLKALVTPAASPT